MAAKIKYIMPLKNAQMSTYTRSIPQLCQQRARNRGNWLVAQIGKAKVKYLCPQGIGILLLAVFKKLHLPECIDETKCRRAA